jgi:glycosyltransferase involved in cell wall biosynthesis
MTPGGTSAGSRKLRVLLLTDEMEVGGTQRQIVHIARGLDRERFEPTVLFFRNPSFFVGELEQAGVRVIQIEKHGRLDLGFVRRLVRTLREERFDVMQCFAFSGELWGAVARRLLPRAQRPALITSVRGVYEWYSKVHWRLKRWVSGQSERVVANSRMGAGYAQERMGLAPGAIRVSYNGVQAPRPDPARAQALRGELGVPEGGLLVLFVGRLVVHKDVPTLLRAVARLRERLPKLRLALAGDGPLQDELAQQVASLSLQPAVTLLGQRDDVTDLIAAADIMVLPSLREGLSNVILEGMMGGKPVVASNAGGNIELIDHERGGLLFDIGDDAALAAALDRLAHDAPLRERLGQGARQRAEAEFSIPSMVRAYEKHYGEAARQGARSH